MEKRPISDRRAWLLLAAILLLLSAAFWIVLRYKFDQNLADARESAQRNNQLIASIASSALAEGRYQEIDNLFTKWGKTNPNIVELRLDSANGFNLSDYKRESDAMHVLEIRLPISYSYHGSAVFTARISLDERYQYNRELATLVTFLFLVFSLLLAYLLHVSLQRQHQMLKAFHISRMYKALSEINQAIVRAEQEVDIFPLVCRCAVQFGGMSMAWLGVIDEESGTIVQHVCHGGRMEQVLPIDSDAPASVALRLGHEVIFNDFSSHAWAKENGYTQYKSTAAFPIARGRKRYAVLQVFHLERGGFDEESIALLKEMSGDVAFALDNHDRHAEREQSEKQLRLAASVYAVSSEGILVTDSDNRIVSVNPAFTEITGYSLEEVRGKEPNILSSGMHEDAFYQEMWREINATGKWSGEIWDMRKSGEVFPKWLTIDSIYAEDGSVLHRVALFTDMTQKKEAEEKIQHLALYDHLTDLPNRMLLLDRLQQAVVSNMRSGRMGALLFIDLDNFKNLNDTLGHDYGDILLKQVTLRLKSGVREGDTVARLGGDEFVVMMADLSALSDEAVVQTEAVGEKILSVLAQSYHLNDHVYRCSASIGAALFKGGQFSVDELMKQADIAMYQAKKAGKNTLRFFDRHMQEAISLRTALENEMRSALSGAQFTLNYQIQVDDQERPLGAEALIRWKHPKRGLIYPDEFIMLAEETSLILLIGHWVLDSACAQIKKWQNDARACQLVLAVNVSAKQFHEPDFVAQVESAVQKHDIDPHKLKLELTESMLVESIESTIEKMSALNRLGIQFSLDDFGTGYSSLQYLKLLPINQLKIDQSFVRDLGMGGSDKVIVSTIITMSKSLGIDVIAEGVETEQQRLFLAKQGCNCYQGYLFGRPAPVEEFDILLQQFSSK